MLAASPVHLWATEVSLLYSVLIWDDAYLIPCWLLLVQVYRIDCDYSAEAAYHGSSCCISCTASETAWMFSCCSLYIDRGFTADVISVTGTSGNVSSEVVVALQVNTEHQLWVLQLKMQHTLSRTAEILH